MNNLSDWRNDPYWLSFAEHMAAALRLVWEHEQKLADCAKGQCDMKSGLLWYDANTSANLMDVIDAAAKRYLEKFGFAADTCFVNSEQLKEFALAHRDALPRTLNLAVLPSHTVIPNHVWIGVSAPAPTPDESAAFEQAKQDAVLGGAPRVAHLYRTEPIP